MVTVRSPGEGEQMAVDKALTGAFHAALNKLMRAQQAQMWGEFRKSALVNSLGSSKKRKSCCCDGSEVALFNKIIIPMVAPKQGDELLHLSFAYLVWKVENSLFPYFEVMEIPWLAESGTGLQTLGDLGRRYAGSVSGFFISEKTLKIWNENADKGLWLIRGTALKHCYDAGGQAGHLKLSVPLFPDDLPGTEVLKHYFSASHNSVDEAPWEQVEKRMMPLRMGRIVEWVEIQCYSASCSEIAQARF